VHGGLSFQKELLGLKWIKNSPNPTSALSPVYPELRTLVGMAGMSQSCQEETLSAAA
jgi:hypothetical protein